MAEVLDAAATLRALLDAAEPFDPADSPAAPKPARIHTPSAAAGTDVKRQLYRVENALQFLRTTGALTIGNYAPWRDVAIALKNDHGEPGWPLFLKMSQDDPSFVSEEECRRLWDGIRTDRPEGERLTCGRFFKQALDGGWQDPTRGDRGRRKEHAAASAAPKLSDGDGAGATLDIASDDAAAVNGSRGGRAKVDAAVVVLDQAEAAGDEFWVDRAGRTFVTFAAEQRGGGTRRVTARINSEAYRGKLAAAYLAETVTKVLPREQENSAVGLLEHRARTLGQVREAAVRVAEHEGAVYVDHRRADGRVTRIDGDGYRVVNTSPVAFVEGRGGELPLAEKGGELDLFRRHFNVATADVPQVVAFCIAIFKPTGPYPIGMVEGPHGTAKTTLLDKILMLGDPPLELIDTHTAPPRSERDLQIEASNERVVAVDNVGPFTAGEANWYCRLATGGSLSFRKNYTDDELIRHRAIRPTIMTGMGPPSGQSDFLSRCLRITIVPPAISLPDEMVRAEFLADRPKMLDFLFRCVAAAIRNGPAMQQALRTGELQLTRMAAFGAFVEGAAEVMGLARGEFAAMLRGDQAVMQAEAAMGDCLGAAIIRCFSSDADETANGVFADTARGNVVEGSATEVLGLFRGYDADSRDWPAVNQLKERLRRLGPGLKEIGIEWEFRKAAGHVNKSVYVITRTAAFVPTGQARRR